VRIRWRAREERFWWRFGSALSARRLLPTSSLELIPFADLLALVPQKQRGFMVFIARVNGTLGGPSLGALSSEVLLIRTWPLGAPGWTHHQASTSYCGELNWRGEER
jgi:hypothetical protein